MSVSALRHTAFLNRLDDDNLSGSGSRRGQAAFLALRVVDLLGGSWQENAQAFEYQRSATERYLTELEAARCCLCRHASRETPHRSQARTPTSEA